MDVHSLNEVISMEDLGEFSAEQKEIVKHIMKSVEKNILFAT